MKRFINVGLAALLVVATAATAQAETMPRVQSMLIASTEMATAQLSAADLVTLARRGYFKDQGIPSYGAFDGDFAAGKITPEILVQGAIATHRLSPSALTDRGYLNAVEAQLIGVRSETL